ncbi:MAG: flagellar motor protein MotA, partial [Fibrobacteraceae bacterium]
MKKIIFEFLTIAFAASFSFAQQNPGDELVKQRAALNSAKADLEDARQKRDMETASRWEDRETQNQERELFNEKYQASKEKVDALMAERTRLMEDVRVAREDLSQVKAATEQARSEFL